MTTALLTAAVAAGVSSGFAQDGDRPVVRSSVSPSAPEAPPAIGSSDPMASARSPRHLLRNGQDYLRYGEYLRALTLFREAEARIGELPDAEQRELRQGIEDAREGMRSPEASREVTARRSPSRGRSGAMPGAIALAEPPRPEPGAIGSTDGVLLTGGERPSPAPNAPAPQVSVSPDLAPPIPPEPISIDPRVLPSAAQSLPGPEGLELPPIASAAPAPAVSNTVPTAAAMPGDLPMLPSEPPAAAAAAPFGLPQLPEEPGIPTIESPTAILGAAPPDPLPMASTPPSPPDELPALPPSAEELMELGQRGAAPSRDVPSAIPAQEGPAMAAPSPSRTPSPRPTTLSARESGRESRGAMELNGLGRRNSPPPRDLLSPEQREEVMRIVRRQEEAERQGFDPAPLPDDPLMPMYEEDELSSLAIELPRPPSPSEIRPIQSIPVAEDFVEMPPRRFAPSRKYWSAAATCHLPLYFQDPVLERYGQSVEQKLGPVGRFLSYPLDDPKQSQQRNQLAQPFFSAGLMAAQIVTWPYKALMDTPSEAEYDLGYYRPGDLVPPDLIYVPLHGVGPPLQGKRY